MNKVNNVSFNTLIKSLITQHNKKNMSKNKDNKTENENNDKINQC